MRLINCLHKYTKRLIGTKLITMTSEVLSPMDPSSFSRPELALVKNIDINLCVNFDKKIFSGFVKLDVQKIDENVNEIILDTKDLAIENITETELNQDVKYSICENLGEFGSKLSIQLPEKSGNMFFFKIDYETSPKASGLQWLAPEQTAGKKHPYLFSQFQAIHARSFLPCQDTPAVKSKYSATISAPNDLTVLMSAIRDHTKQCEAQGAKLSHFVQNVPIPSYLIAIAIGALESRKIGPRSHVWAEKEFIEESAFEFANTEHQLKTAEDICGPYVWGIYDLLVLPPSFPYGGMENPCLTFVTPTLLQFLEMDIKRKVNLSNELSKSVLSKILLTSTNSKFVILEGKVIKALEKVCGVRWLKSKGVEKIFKLESGGISLNTPADVFYMIFSNFDTFKLVIDQIRAVIDLENPTKGKFHVIVVPKVPFLFEKYVEELGLYQNGIQLHSFHWFPLCIDKGLLSLELPNVFRNLYVLQNLTPLTSISTALWQTSMLIGRPNFCLSLGQHSSSILRQYETLCEQKGCSDLSEPEIDSLVIMDRNIDYPSCFLTPGTYAALLKEIYEVYAGTCYHKSEETASYDNLYNPVVKKDPVNIIMDHSDPIYTSIKNEYLTKVTSFLGNLAKELKMKCDTTAMNLDAIKKCVNELGATSSKKKNLTNHLIAAETIINCLGNRYEDINLLEYNLVKNDSKSSNFKLLLDLMCTENNAILSLRLFCLMLVTQQLDDSEIKTFSKQFVHQFGFKYGYVWQNLTNAGILPEPKAGNLASKLVNLKIPKLNANNFYTNANKLKQIPQDPDRIDLNRPSCPSYVFRGLYVPSIVQIVSLLLNSTPLEEIRTKLDSLGNLIIKNDRAYPVKKRCLAVFVVGGITYAEIAALNFVEELTGANVLIMSDRIISGNDVIEGLLEHPKHTC